MVSVYVLHKCDYVWNDDFNERTDLIVCLCLINNLLESSCPMLIEANLKRACSHQINNLINLSLSTVLCDLLAKIVAKWIVHQLNEMREDLLENVLLEVNIP